MELIEHQFSPSEIIGQLSSYLERYKEIIGEVFNISFKNEINFIEDEIESWKEYESRRGG